MMDYQIIAIEYFNIHELLENYIESDLSLTKWIFTKTLYIFNWQEVRKPNRIQIKGNREMN